MAVLYDAFQPNRAMETVAFGDGFVRAPAGDGYEAVLAHLRDRLEASGFGSSPWLELEELVVEEDATGWTPVSASVAIEEADGARALLHEFHEPAATDRLLLPVGAPACDISGKAVFELSEVEPGVVLVTDAPSTFDILRRAQSRGAAAVLSASLAGYNVLPDTDELLPDALRFRIYPKKAKLPVCQISRRSLAVIRAAHDKHGSVRLRIEAEVSLEKRPVRMLVATIVGAELPNEAVVLPSHIEFSGASDNASGFAATLEGATALVELIGRGQLKRPKRSLVFLWGPQIRQSERWLEHTTRTAVASITLLAAGDAVAHDGSAQFLERPPDPGAVRPLHPDKHTQWGSDTVDPETLAPNGLGLIARCAMAEVSALVGGWRVVDHPWEGGSDHDSYIEAGVPAALFWHFTDSWYHTSLDRLDKIDPEELRRSGVVTLATALAVAAPGPEDLAHYLSVLEQDQRARVRTAQVADDEELAQIWREWCAGSRVWLTELCR